MHTECSCSLSTLPEKAINNNFTDQENCSLESGSMRVSISPISSGPNGARYVSEVMFSDDTSHSGAKKKAITCFLSPARACMIIPLSFTRSSSKRVCLFGNSSMCFLSISRAWFMKARKVCQKRHCIYFYEWENKRTTEVGYEPVLRFYRIPCEFAIVREARIRCMTRQILTDVTYVLYTSHVTHQLLRYVIFKPENDTSGAIGEVVTPCLRVIIFPELQRQFHGCRQGPFYVEYLLVRLLSSPANFGGNFRISNVSVSENFLVVTSVKSRWCRSVLTFKLSA